MKFKNSLHAFFNHPQSRYFLLAMAVILVVAPIWWSVDQGSKPLRVAGEARVITELGKSRRIFEGGVTPSMTIFEAILAASEAGKITVKYSVDQNNYLRIIEMGEYPGGMIEVLKNYRPVDPKRLHATPTKPGDIIVVTTNE